MLRARLERFNRLYAEYRKAPGVTRERAKTLMLFLRSCQQRQSVG